MTKIIMFIKPKIKETIHMLLFTNQSLKAQKHINHREYCHHIKEFILESENS